MAIGTAAAIGLGVGVGGSLLTSKNNKKAINRATDAQTAATDQSIALQRDIYGQNRQALAPFMERGNRAGDMLAGLYGIGEASQPTQQANALSQFRGPTPYGGAGAPYGLGDNALIQGRTFPMGDPRDFTGGVPSYGGFQGTPSGIANETIVQPTSEAEILASGQSPQESAFDTFRNSTGYQFRLGEGLDAVKSAYAGIGGLQSGAAMRGITEYGQNTASNEFGNFVNGLALMQGTGAGSASSLAGVGQNFANNVTNLNQTQAGFLGNAAVAKANNNNALLGSVLNTAGSFIGGL